MPRPLAPWHDTCCSICGAFFAQLCSCRPERLIRRGAGLYQDDYVGRCAETVARFTVFQVPEADPCTIVMDSAGAGAAATGVAGSITALLPAAASLQSTRTCHHAGCQYVSEKRLEHEYNVQEKNHLSGQCPRRAPLWPLAGCGCLRTLCS